MKKTLIALAALAATGAFAQVSVYGRLDAGVAMTTTTTNGVDTKANGVQSHNSASSFWGIKGSEDLGGGLKAGFQLEQDIYTANGNTGSSGANGGTPNVAGFNRVSKVGLDGGFGSIYFGRDYVPTFKLISASDVNGLSRIDTVNYTGTSTTDSLVMYSTPVFSGFQANLALRNADNSTDGKGDTTSKLTNLTVTYNNGPLMVGLGTSSLEDKKGGFGATAMSLSGFSGFPGGFAPGITDGDKVTNNVAAASYNFGSFKLTGNYIAGKVTGGAADGVEVNELNVGATVPLGKVTVIAQVGQNTVKVPVGDNFKGTDMVIGAEYALSAKTALFAKTGSFGKLDAANGSKDYKTTSTAVGLRTVF